MADVYNDTGVAQLQLGQYEAAVKSFTDALEYSSDMPQALFNRALALEGGRRYDEAREAWKRFISSNSSEEWKAEARSRLELLEAPDLK